VRLSRTPTIFYFILPILLAEKGLFFVRFLTEATTTTRRITKSLHNLDRIHMTTIGTIDLIANLRLNVSTTPPFMTAIAMKVIEKFEGNFHISEMIAEMSSRLKGVMHLEYSAVMLPCRDRAKIYQKLL